MAIVLEEFVSKLMYDVDTKKIDEFKKGAKEAIDVFAKLGVVVTGALTVASAKMLQVNKDILGITNTSKALGVSYKFWDGLSDNMEIAGFQAGELSKAIGYMSRNLGELKRGGEGAKIFQEAFTDMGLSLKDFEGKSVEEQFFTLADGIRNLGGKDVEKAMSATKDFLQMRGIAGNKFVRFLVDSEMSLQQIIERTNQIDFMDNDAIQGSYNFMKQWNDLTLVLLDSIQQRVSGLVGDAIAPMIESVLDWAAANRELIETKIKQWVESIVRALKWFFGVVKNGYSIISKIVDVFGGWENVLKIVATAMVALPIAKMLLALSQLKKLDLLRSALAALASPIVIVTALLVIAALAIEDLVTWFQGGESVLGKFGEKVGQTFYNLDEIISNWIASLFGISPADALTIQAQAFEDFKNGIIKVFTTLRDLIVNAVDFWVDHFSNKVKTLWELLPKVSKGFYTAIISPFVELRKKISEVFGDIEKFINKAKNFKIFGKNIGEIIANFKGEEYTAPAASPGISPSSSVVNNRSSRKTVNSSPKIIINQAVGESGEALASRVTKVLEQNMQRSVLANATGVEY